MANHASAEKRARQANKRKIRNQALTSAMKTAIRKVKDAIAGKDLTNVDELFKKAQSVIAATRSKGVIHRNNMSRRISRLSLAVNKIKSSSGQAVQG